jgi:hypothetical protein
VRNPEVLSRNPRGTDIAAWSGKRWFSWRWVIVSVKRRAFNSRTEPSSFFRGQGDAR